MESNFVEAGGVRMRWEEQGDGQPVVFVHGIPTSPLLWRHVIPRVDSARCLAWEMVGYGASIAEGARRDISVARQAAYLADWMRGVGLGDGAVIAGHDLGGGVAQILAVRYPELVRGLALASRPTSSSSGPARPACPRRTTSRSAGWHQARGSSCWISRRSREAPGSSAGPRSN